MGLADAFRGRHYTWKVTTIRDDFASTAAKRGVLPRGRRSFLRHMTQAEQRRSGFRGLPLKQERSGYLLSHIIALITVEQTIDV